MSERPESDAGAPEIASQFDNNPSDDAAWRKEELPYESAERVRRIYGKRNPDAVIEARRQRLYKRQLDGLTIRQLVLEHAEREGIAVKTAWSDWDCVKQWVKEDFDRERPNLVSRIGMMRERLFNQAIKKGQLQTAAMLLKDMGAVVGEVAPETQAAQAPSLSIVVEDRRQTGA